MANSGLGSSSELIQYTNPNKLGVPSHSLLQYVALDHIKDGELLLVERPVALLPLDPLSNCSHCLYNLNYAVNTVPCRLCPAHLFCSDKCENIFHETNGLSAECNNLDLWEGVLGLFDRVLLKSISSIDWSVLKKKVATWTKQPFACFQRLETTEDWFMQEVVVKFVSSCTDLTDVGLEWIVDKLSRSYWIWKVACGGTSELTMRFDLLLFGFPFL